MAGQDLELKEKRETVRGMRPAMHLQNERLRLLATLVRRIEDEEIELRSIGCERTQTARFADRAFFQPKVVAGKPAFALTREQHDVAWGHRIGVHEGDRSVRRARERIEVALSSGNGLSKTALTRKRRDAACTFARE
jgi:hypothetical protein